MAKTTYDSREFRSHNKSGKPDNIVKKENDIYLECEAIQKELPNFLRPYFVYLKSNVLPMTRLAYLHDVKFFMNYLINETDLTKVQFEKYPDENTYLPVLQANEFEEGTGHHSLIREDGVWYAVYHARDRKADGLPGDRRERRVVRQDRADDDPYAVRVFDVVVGEILKKLPDSGFRPRIFPGRGTRGRKQRAEERRSQGEDVCDPPTNAGTGVHRGQ